MVIFLRPMFARKNRKALLKFKSRAHKHKLKCSLYAWLASQPKILLESHPKEKPVYIFREDQFPL